MAGVIVPTAGSPEKKISRQIGWLNYNAGLSVRISCSDVINTLVMLGETEAMQILKTIEENAANISNPTAYILAVAEGDDLGIAAVTAPAIQPQGMAPLTAGPINGADPTGKISRQVGWLNQNAGLRERISFTDVLQPLSEIPVHSAMKILKDLEQNSASVHNPTGYVMSAARRLTTASPAGALKRPLQEALSGPGARYMDEGARKIARQIGWLNQNVPLAEKISYTDVHESLERCELRVAMKLMKDLEASGAHVQSPTKWLVSAARRAACSGEQKQAADSRSAVTTCWDFVQGRCPRGDACRYSHVGGPPSAEINDVGLKASAMGLLLNEDSLQDLSSIPDSEAEALLQELVSGGKDGKGIEDNDGYVSKACSRIRAEYFNNGRNDTPGKRMRLGMF